MSKSGRPWRILNLNHGIIVTRTHNVDIINSVFVTFIRQSGQSNSTARFFADSMNKIDIIDYPKHAKHVVEQFYQLTNQHYINVINLKK